MSLLVGVVGGLGIWLVGPWLLSLLGPEYAESSTWLLRLTGLAAPAVANLDADPALELVAARHSVLYAWDDDGSLLWRAAWAHEASDPDEHGSTRMWASPVVGDFDADGDLEIAVGADADSSDNVNVAVYDHEDFRARLNVRTHLI